VSRGPEPESRNELPGCDLIADLTGVLCSRVVEAEDAEAIGKPKPFVMADELEVVLLFLEVDAPPLLALPFVACLEVLPTSAEREEHRKQT
jgi:hypothetical protein